MEYILGMVVGIIISAVIGMAIGDLGGKKNALAGALLGGLLGPIGWIITAVLAPSAMSGTPQAGNAKDDEIRQLEARLASLKTPSLQTSKPAPTRHNDDDDGGIPTYKLD